MTRIVDSNYLASVLVLQYDLEPKEYPEPFRMQPSVELVLPFSEYIKFVRSLPRKTEWLYYKTDALQSAGDASLLRAFYYDVALAVGKELYFAEYYHRPATVIRHCFDLSCNQQKQVVVTQSAQKTFWLNMMTKQYSFDHNVMSENSQHLAYALKLIQDAQNGPTMWVEPPLKIQEGQSIFK